MSRGPFLGDVLENVRRYNWFRMSEETKPPDPPKAITEAEVSKLIKDQIDLRNTYLDVVTKQMDGDRRFLLYLIGLAVVLFSVAQWFSYKSVKDMRDDIRDSAKAAADQVLEKLTADSKRTLDGFIDSTSKSVTERIDARLQEPEIKSTISTEVRKFTRESISELSAEQVKDALASSPQIRVAIALTLARLDQRRSYEQLLQLRNDLSLPADVRIQTRNGVAELIDVFKPDPNANPLLISLERPCRIYIPTDVEVCPNRKCDEKSLSILREGLASSSKQRTLCTMNVMLARRVLPPEIRPIIWKYIRESDSITVTLKAIEMLNSLRIGTRLSSRVAFRSESRICL
jgi:hypothetical protein